MATIKVMRTGAVESMVEALGWAKRFPFEALSRIYPGEYGARGEIELRQVFEMQPAALSEQA